MTTLEFNYQLEQAYPRVMGYTYKFTSNEDESADLLHDTVLQALKNRDKFNDGTNFKAWIYTIMRNIFINKYRRQTKLQNIINNQPEFTNLSKSASYLPNPQEYTVVNEIKDKLNTLRAPYQTVFKMYIEGYKYHEIADQLNIPIGTVKTRIHKAREILSSQVSPSN